MKNQIRDWIKKHKKGFILVALLWTVILLGIAVSLGAYTNQAYRKGVVSTAESDTMFSSNYLQLYRSESYNSQVIIFSDSELEQDTLQTTVYIYNYVQKDSTQVNSNDINYNISFKLQGNPAAETKGQYLINNMPAFSTSDAYTLSNQLLLGRDKHREEYTIVMPTTDLGKVFITVEAIPDDTSMPATNWYKLAAVLSPSEAGSVKEFTCTGNYSDAITSGNETNYPYQFDAFNYEVAISSGNANVTLSWDANKVEIDPFFVENLQKQGISPSTVENNKIIFEMQEKIANSYLIKFYRKEGPNGTDSSSWQASWENMQSQNVISVSGEQKLG